MLKGFGVRTYGLDCSTDVTVGLEWYTRVCITYCTVLILRLLCFASCRAINFSHLVTLQWEWVMGR